MADGRTAQARAACALVRRRGCDHPLHWFAEWWKPDFDFAPYLDDIASAMSQSLARWDAFVQAAAAEETITVFDGFPFLDTLGFFVSGETTDEQLLWYAREVQERIKPLSPVLIYLRQPDVRGALRRMLDLRGEGLERELFYNFGRFPFCAARSFTDFECVAQTWERMPRIVEQVLPDYAAHQMECEITAQSWETSREQMLTFLGLVDLPKR